MPSAKNNVDPTGRQLTQLCCLTATPLYRGMSVPTEATSDQSFVMRNNVMKLILHGKEIFATLKEHVSLKFCYRIVSLWALWKPAFSCCLVHNSIESARASAGLHALLSWGRHDTDRQGDIRHRSQRIAKDRSTGMHRASPTVKH